MSTENKLTDISVLFVDDHPMTADGFGNNLMSAQLVSSFVVSETLAEALLLLSKPHAFDVVVLDLKLDDSIGLESIESVQSILPAIPIVVFSEEDSQKVIDSAYEMGVKSYISKRLRPAECVKKFDAVLIGYVYKHKRITYAGGAQLNVSQSALSRSTKSQEFFSPRQCQVFELLLEDLSYKQIASQLEISENTVKSHARGIYQLLGIQKRSGLFHRALELDLVEAPVRKPF